MTQTRHAFRIAACLLLGMLGLGAETAAARLSGHAVRLGGSALITYNSAGSYEAVAPNGKAIASLGVAAPGSNTAVASADGTMIAFPGRGSAGYDLVLRNLRTGAEKIVLHSATWSVPLSFSADGSTLLLVQLPTRCTAFTWAHPSQLSLADDTLTALPFNLPVANFDGGAGVDGGWVCAAPNATLTPDGSEILYSFDGQAIIDSNKGMVSQFIYHEGKDGIESHFARPGALTSPTFSRDGSQLAYVSGASLVVSTPAGAITHRFPKAAAAGYPNIAWSPDGSQIAYSCAPAPHNKFSDAAALCVLTIATGRSTYIGNAGAVPVAWAGPGLVRLQTSGRLNLAMKVRGERRSIGEWTNVITLRLSAVKGDLHDIAISATAVDEHVPPFKQGDGMVVPGNKLSVLMSEADPFNGCSAVGNTCTMHFFKQGTVRTLVIKTFGSSERVHLRLRFQTPYGQTVTRLVDLTTPGLH